MDLSTDFPAPKCNVVAHWLGKLIIKLSGWKVKGEVPQSQSMVVIAAPHTSNWDFLILLCAAYSLGLSVNWLGKSKLFLPVLGPVMRFLGGISVNRSKHTKLVTQLTEKIHASKGISLVISPAGTRSYTDYWKSGFYHLAIEADIPVVCGYLDFPRKEAGLGLSFHLSGNITADMDQIRAFYADKVGIIANNKSRISLKEED